MGDAARTERNPESARHAAVFVARQLRDAGFLAYFAGGCVRDELLGLRPTDYDIATNATPDRVGSLFRSTAHVGVSFGVMLVRLTGRDLACLEGPHTIEVATFRADGAYSDKRRPDSVSFADEHADAKRRDFTVNAMFLDPLDEPDSSGAEGRLIDHVGGMADLQGRLIRAVGAPEARLAEDHLRALRGVRFASRLGFDLEAGTREAISCDAASLAGVSRERIGDEVRRMLRHPNRRVAVQLMRDLGLEQAVLGEPRAVRSLSRLGGLPGNAEFTTSLAAWAIDRGDDGAGYRARLCLSNAESDELVQILDGVARAEYDWPLLPVAQRKRLAARSTFLQSMEVIRAGDADCGSKLDDEIRKLASHAGGLGPMPLLVGRDLIEEGVRPGPAFGLILDRVYDAQLEGRLQSRDDAVRLAKQILGDLSADG